MAYVEAHATLRNHPKTKKAAHALGVPCPTVIGHLLCLWWWCQDYAQDGNLSDYSAAEIAEAADWKNDPDTFVDALLNCGRQNEPGFLELAEDRALLVHDWRIYGGKLFVKRQQGAKRQANWREHHIKNASGNVSETLPDGVSNALLTHNVTQDNAYREEETREDEKREDETREETPSRPLDPAFGAAIRSFENEIGLVSGSLLPDMTDIWDTLTSRGTPEWWQQAITVAVGANKRGWSYMRGILTRCMAEGHPPSYRRNGTNTSADPYAALPPNQ